MFGDKNIIADPLGDAQPRVAAIASRDPSEPPGQNGNSAPPARRPTFTPAQPVEHTTRIDQVRETIAKARTAHDGREVKTYCPQHEFTNAESNPSLSITVN